MEIILTQVDFGVGYEIFFSGSSFKYALANLSSKN